MKEIKIKSYVRRKTPFQLKRAMSFDDMLPITIKSHTRKILKK